MRPRLFWLTAAFFLGLALHAGYLLFAPGLALGRSIVASGVAIDQAAFRILAQSDQSALFPTYPPASVFGLCAFDVTANPAKISASMPDTFWTLTIYSRSGKVIYALNSRQAATSSFTVSLSRAPSLIESLLKTSAEDLSSQDGWTVSAAEPKGIAVMWVPVGEPAQRAAVERTLKSTRCEAAPPQP
jgi:uncharacterized membrane protein